jgi:hypothetical protein
MLTSDKLIFVELQKAGSTGLKKFLGNIVGGESTGKTSVYADELLALGKPIVGLVCHPLVWYLDQWRLGCAGRGELYKHLVDEKRWNLLRSHAAKAPAKSAAKASAKGEDKDAEKTKQKEVPPEWGADYAKTRWYGDENNVEAFQEWLAAVALHPGLRNLIDRGYKVSRIGKLAGPMTYQFVIRFLRDGENIERSIDTLDALRAFIEERAITTQFVRAEYAGEDLLRVLDALGIETTAEQREQAAQFKRRGAEAKLVRQFYDDASMRLVAEREQLMGELFGYELVAPSGSPSKPGKQRDKPKDKPEKAGQARAEGQEDGPKLSKEERALKREARSERRAAKEAKAAQPAAGTPPMAAAAPAAEAADTAPEAPPSDEKPASAVKAAKAVKADKPAKAKRTKSRPVDDDVVEVEA